MKRRSFLGALCELCARSYLAGSERYPMEDLRMPTPRLGLDTWSSLPRPIHEGSTTTAVP